MLAVGEKVPVKDVKWKGITLENWESHFDKTHRGGVGVRCGKLSGIVVIDLDNGKKDKVDGSEYWQRLESIHAPGGKVKTRRNKTKHGEHLYFKWNKWTARLKGRQICCMTDKCSGQKVAIDYLSYSMYAKNFGEDGSYVWDDPHAEIAEFPEWLYNAMDPDCYDTGYAPSEISSTTSVEREWEDVGRAGEAGPADTPHGYARAQIGDIVDVGGVKVQLTPELIRTVLNYQPEITNYNDWMCKNLLNIRATVRSGDAITYAEKVFQEFDAWSSNRPGYDENNNARLWMNPTTIKSANKPAAHIESLIGIAVKNGLRVQPPVNPFYDSQNHIGELVDLARSGHEFSSEELNDWIYKTVGHVSSHESIWAIKKYDDIEKRVTVSIGNSLKGFSRHQVKITGVEKPVKLIDAIRARAPEYHSITNELSPPGEPVPDTGRCLNISPRWAVDSRLPADEEPDPKISNAVHRVVDVLSDHDRKASGYMMLCMWFLFMRPEMLPEVATFIVSTEGAGKGSLMTLLLALMGGLARTFTGADSVLGKFNSTIEGLRLIIMDELLIENWHKFSDHMKALTTTPVIKIENKGVDARHVRHKAGIMVTTNHFNPMKMESLGRRYFCLRASEELIGDKSFWNYWYQEVVGTPRGLQHALEVICRANPDETWHPRQNIVVTEAATSMVSSSMSACKYFLKELLADKPRDKTYNVSNGEMKTILSDHFNSTGERINPRALGKELKDYFAITSEKFYVGEGEFRKQVRGYKFKISEVEAMFQRFLGSSFTL